MLKLKGFTLIELLAVLAIASILFGVGFPAMENIVRDNASSAAAYELIANINWAREASIQLGTRVAICRSGNASAPGVPQCDQGPSTDPTHDGYEDGWLLFTDPDHKWQPQQASDILRRYQGITSGGITIRGQSNGNDPDHVGFTSLGLSAGTTGTLVICDARGWALKGHWARVIVISPDGRIRALPGDSPGLSVSSCTPT